MKKVIYPKKINEIKVLLKNFKQMQVAYGESESVSPKRALFKKIKELEGNFKREFTSQLTEFIIQNLENLVSIKELQTLLNESGMIKSREHSGKKPVKIMEAQVGSILKETDIVRYQDIYGRVK